MMFWYGPGMTGWGYALMTISMVLFWALVIFGVVALVRFFTRVDQSTTTRPTPEQLLADRFARGRSTSRSITIAWPCCGAYLDRWPDPEREVSRSARLC
jgi:putative membrane protein